MLRELNSRESDGIAVTMDWDSRTNEIVITAEDRRTDTLVSFIPDNAKAAEAFLHPFAYAMDEAPVVWSDLDDLDDPENGLDALAEEERQDAYPQES